MCYNCKERKGSSEADIEIYRMLLYSKAHYRLYKNLTKNTIQSKKNSFSTITSYLFRICF
jgi:hypothetical protein